MRRNSYIFTLAFVGMIAAFGPFVTDFYLPALPALSEYFAAPASMIQLSLTVSMIGLGAGQLVVGPLSDRYGRRLPLLLSLAAFIAATAGCIATDSIGRFLAYRFVQGLAGAGGLVISRSIATDLYSGRELARFFSVLGSVQGIVPVAAPVIGGLLLAVTDWKGIFTVLLGIGVVLLAMTLVFRESLAQRSLSITASFKGYAPVLRNRRSMRYMGLQAMAMGVMFSYISASPFIFQQQYGLSPVAYSLCFGLNAFGIMAGSLLVLRSRSSERGLALGARGFFVMALVTALVLTQGGSVWIVEASLFVLLVMLGTILPTSTTLALEPLREHSGSASAALGFLSFLVGGICSPLVGMGDMTLSTSAVITVCALATLLLARGADHTPATLQADGHLS
ncbi:MAG: multidrug effflux MFS transporter [Alistipes sp.]|nr:multidrug effflux MFS transporter [Alistipes sp.]